MSQKENKFQSKSKKFGEGGKGRGKPAGRGFGKKFEGDRGERPARGGKSFGGGGKSYGRGSDRDAPRSRDDGDYRPRKPRAEGSDSRGGDRPFRDKKPYEKKFGEKKFGDKPRRDFGDRPARGDRPPRGDRDDRPRSDRPRRDFGDKPRRDFGDKKFGDKKFGDKPRRDFGDRPPRGDRDDRPRSDRPRRDFGDKPRRDYNDRPQRRFDREQEQDFAPRAEATPETRQRLKSDRPGYGAPSSAYLYGAHAVRAALGNPKRVHQRLLVTTAGYEAIQEAYEDAQAEGLRLPQPMYVENIDIERLLPRDAVHQGILLDSQPAEEVFLQDILISAPADAKIVVLDQVTDPHNVGAILRSASAFGAYAVVMQRLNAPDITGTLAKTASGAAEYVPIVREVNLSRALEQLKEAGFFCIGLDERGKQTIAEAAPKGRVALVMGAEGDGLRRLVGENCDVLAKLPTQGPIASLNVSNAAAVALYEVIRNG